MKFWGAVRFELGYQLRRPWPWLFFAVLLGIDFLLARDAALVDALYEDFFVNSPFAVANTTVIGGLLWLLAAPMVGGEAGARDLATGMHPLAWTAPVSKTEYLGGRFLAALILNALILLAVPAGILLAVYSPGVNPEVIGPFRPAAFLNAYLFISLPNAFVATGIQFAFAVWSGRAMAGYVGSMLLVFTGFFVATVVRFLFDQRLGMLLDPVGINFIVEDLAHEWTAIERKSRLLALEGTVLTNRLVWLGVGVTTLAVTWLRFRFAHRTESSWWRRLSRRRSVPDPAAAGREAFEISSIATPQPPRAFGFAIHVRATLAIAWTSFRAIASSWAGLALLAAIPLMTVLILLDQMSAMNTPLVPRTALVLRELTGGISAELAAEPNRWVIVPLFLVFFAGELVWREREAGLDEITDAMPGSEWGPLLGKFLGLSLVLALFMALLTSAGILAQVIIGYHDFEIGLYLTTLFGLQLPEYLLFALLMLVVHVVVNQKYVGHLVGVLAYVFVAVLAARLGIEHNLLVYGGSPAWDYTEMRGFGPFVGPWLWFKLYWAGWAVLLAVAARLLWRRGREGSLRSRLRVARRRFTRATLATVSAAAAITIALGAFIFYNTNVLNDYLSTAAVKERHAEYERRYRRYAGTPQPRLARTSLQVQIHPERRAVEIRGAYDLVNDTGGPIDSIHVATGLGGVDTRAMAFDRPATLTVNDTEHGYRIYALQRSLEPGDTLRLDFELGVGPRGFRNRGLDRAVVANGTYFTSEAWFPFIGYQRGRELLTASDRRDHGLEPRPVIASLYDVEGREPAARGGGIMFDAVIATDANQTAVAPGTLRRTWTEGARRYFHYSTDAPIGAEWAFFSADYAVQEGAWSDSSSAGGRPVAIRIFHDPEHTGHLDRMMRSVRASLDFYTREFGPYPYRHVTVVEHPGATGTGAHADPGIISHGQGFAFLQPEGNPRAFDLSFFVMAHEMAHQWTVPYALVEGVPFLSEGLANYFAMGVVEAALGGEQLRRLLAFMRQPYPYRPIRRGEPLLQALDPYLSRRRGPFAMRAMSEYAGADRVNRAVRRLIETHDAPGASLATTLDLYRELQAVTPDSLKYLLHDLFEVNTLWRFETERVTVRETETGAWEVTLAVRARKIVYDSAGVETDMPMDELVPIGVFAPAADGEDELSRPLHFERHRIRSGQQTITVTVARKPALAGIDPYHLLDWEEEGDDDNIEGVT